MEPQKKDWYEKTFYFTEEEFDIPTPDEASKGVTRMMKMVQKRDNVINKFKREHPGKVKASQMVSVSVRDKVTLVVTLFYEE